MGLSEDELFIVNVVDEQNINIELQEIKNELNTFLNPYPKDFKRKLIADVKQFVRELEAQLNDKSQLNSQALINISNLLNEFYDTLQHSVDTEEICFGSQAHFTEETKDYLLKLIEKYVVTVHYGRLFQLVEIEDFETSGGEELQEIVERFRWISVEHLELNLNEDDEDVRMFIYSAIRSLLLVTSVKAPHQKLNCISQFCKFVMGALCESRETDPSQSISADDFLPALIYSLLKAKVPQLTLHVSFINHFMGIRRDLEYGEVAYHFTNFNAALDFIRNLDGSNLADSTDGALISKYFNNSVNLLHDEVRSMNQKRREEVLRSLKDKITKSQKVVASEKSDIKEKKCWNVIKWIPILNVGYGGARSICYICKGNKEEALNSVVGVAGGLAGLGAGIAAATISGPLIVPITAGLICSGTANQAVTGGGELAIEAHENPSQFGLFKKLSPDGREKKIYLKMIKDAPILGMIYSTVRSTVYLAKGNKQEAKQSSVNAVVNAGASAAGIGAGIGMAKLSSQLTNVASTAIENSDDVLKPMSHEVIEFITAQAARVAASPSVNVAAHVGANACSRYIIEEGILNESDDCLF